LARDPRYAEDPPARDIDFCNGGHGFQTFGQDLAWTVFEVEHIKFVHRRAFSTIHAFERQNSRFMALPAKLCGPRKSLHSTRRAAAALAWFSWANRCGHRSQV